MAVEQHLEPEERVLASWREFHATDRRLIRYVDNPLGPEVESLEYERIRTIRLAVRPKVVWLAVGLVIALVGMFLPPTVPQRLAFFTTLVGAGIALFGILNRRIYVEFRGEGLDSKAQSRWRMEVVRHPQARELVLTVRSHLPSTKKPRE